MVRKILVALDASDDRTKVATMVRELATGRPGVEVTLLHVAPPVPERVRREVSRLDKEMGIDADVDAMLERDALRILQPVKDLLDEAQIDSRVETAVGDPGAEICRLAAMGNYDLVVMGRRGLSRLQEAFLGSVTEYVLRNSRIPVLIVQFPRDGEKKGD